MAAPASLIRHRSPLSVNADTGEFVVRDAPQIPVRVVAATASVLPMLVGALILFYFLRR